MEDGIEQNQSILNKIINETKIKNKVENKQKLYNEQYNINKINQNESKKQIEPFSWTFKNI